jgi:hypothetical protein
MTLMSYHLPVPYLVKWLETKQDISWTCKDRTREDQLLAFNGMTMLRQDLLLEICHSL